MTQNSKRLLIVDDDNQIRELLVFDIAQSGYIVDSASDGQEGLKKALENNYDLILLDVMMPKMNGYEVARTVRKNRCSTPILMLTAKSGVEDRIEGLNAGADYYLTKPFDTRELLACINALLRLLFFWCG